MEDGGEEGEMKERERERRSMGLWIDVCLSEMGSISGGSFSCVNRLSMLTAAGLTRKHTRADTHTHMQRHKRTHQAHTNTHTRAHTQSHTRIHKHI